MKMIILSCCQQVSVILDCWYLLLGSVGDMGDSDTRVSHSQVLLNYRNMLGKGKQTAVGLWAADNFFLRKDTRFGVEG